jgi:hypothetical protein
LLKLNKNEVPHRNTSRVENVREELTPGSAAHDERQVERVCSGLLPNLTPDKPEPTRFESLETTTSVGFPTTSLHEPCVVTIAYNGRSDLALRSQVYHYRFVESELHNAVPTRLIYHYRRFGRRKVFVTRSPYRPTVRCKSGSHSTHICPCLLTRFLKFSGTQLGVEFGSKLITIPEEDNKVVKLQCKLSPFSTWITAYDPSPLSIT